jgi:hypothetical protein
LAAISDIHSLLARCAYEIEGWISDLLHSDATKRRSTEDVRQAIIDHLTPLGLLRYAPDLSGAVIALSVERRIQAENLERFMRGESRRSAPAFPIAPRGPQITLPAQPRPVS